MFSKNAAKLKPFGVKDFIFCLIVFHFRKNMKKQALFIVSGSYLLH